MGDAIRKVQKFLYDDNLVEREDFKEENNSILDIGVEWLQNYHQKLSIDNDKRNYDSNINIGMICASNKLNNTNPYCKDLWIADSGTSCHMTNSKDGMTNLITNNFQIKIGNGHNVSA